MRVGWVAVWVGASCGYPDLPRLAGVDASGDGADVDAAPPVQYSSCLGLAFTCGPSGTGSCCEPAEVIEGGTFKRGFDAAPDAYNEEIYPATVSRFVLDKYEVTVGRFRKFVEEGLGTQERPPAAGAGAHPRLANSGWDSAWNGSLAANPAELVTRVKCSSTYQTWTDTPATNEHLPMNCVTWYEAMAFCIWDGGYLPTEAEWQYAASGGDQQRSYPWSNPASDLSIDCNRANYRPSTYCVNDPTGSVSRVGSRQAGDGRWKHSDLAGNVWEWTLDWYVNPFPNAQTCSDCANLTPSSYRVLRGGGFYYDASYLRAANRYSSAPIYRVSVVGFRCARTP